ncbi:MAG TPA: TIGR03619 family F420-dependent LLM class oxidoreductase [Dehalococcoidia bacterium]
MRYGFYLPTRGSVATPATIEALVQRAEALGFHSVVISDHIVLPVTFDSKYPYTVSGAFPSDGDALEQLALMSFVAAKTSRLRLITSVMILPHRNPVVSAKSLATIDVLSEGRVTVGVGVGWLREEFMALGAPEFDQRGAVSDECLRIFKALWTESPASFEGEFYRFGPLWVPAAAGAEAASADLDRGPQPRRPEASRALRRRLASRWRQPRIAAKTA